MGRRTLCLLAALLALAGAGCATGETGSTVVLSESGASVDGRITSSGTRLRDNGAFDNRLLGIDAVAGVTDLGHNRAHGNGAPLQCRNVFCSP